jgi:hypothetical protein
MTNFSLSFVQRPIIEKRQTKVCRTLSMFFCGRLSPLDQFFITAAFALPRRIHGARIGGVLIYRSFRGNYFTAAAGTSAASGGALIDINTEQKAFIVQ